MSELYEAGVALFTLVLAALTGVLAWETRRLRLLNKTPHVVITIEPSRYRHFYNLVIENVGPGIAVDLRCSFQPELFVTTQSHQVPISNSEVLRVPILKGGQRIATYLGNVSEISPHQSVATCICRNADGRSHRTSNGIDLRPYESIQHVGGDTMSDISRELGRIVGLLEQIARRRS